MIILRFDELPLYQTDAPVSALNSVWQGTFQQTQALPQLGHLFAICPQENAQILCAGAVVDSNHYILLNQPTTLKNLRSTDAHVLVLMLSDGFIAHMAEFLGIPPNLQDLLYGIPLLNGDMLSGLLRQLITHPEQTEEIFMDIVGQILQLLRHRHAVLQGLSGHKHRTTQELLTCLMQARQFIEAQFLEPIKTVDVANHVGLSEYHFARLFKTAFDITVHQYVMRLRLEKSRHLLETSSQPITDIALDIGYNSLSAFINAFRKHTNMPPSTFRTRFKSNL